MTDVLSIHVAEPAGLAREREPVTLGVPFPRGLLADPTCLGAIGTAGEAVPLQAAALARWPDGSVKWALVDLQVTLGAHSRADYRLHAGDHPSPVPGTPAIKLVHGIQGIQVDTGSAWFTVDARRLRPLLRAVRDGRELLDPGRSDCRIVTADGKVCTPTIDRVTVETPGLLRATVRLEGVFAADGQAPVCEFVARLSFFAGRDTVRLGLTLRNPRRARHPENLWDLGDAGSIFIRDAFLSLGVAESGPTRIECSTAPGEPLAASSGSLDLYQDSSGGERWDSPNHVTREGRITTAFRGYRLRASDREDVGMRATPLLGLWAGSTGVAMTMRHFWQNFPKALDARDGALTVRLFPAQSADVHELQGGEQKTHVLHLAFPAAGADLEASLGWARAPVAAHVSPEWCGRSGAVAHLTPRATDPSPAAMALVDAAIDGDDTFAHKREQVDEYGWRHFGDIYADHEQVNYPGAGPVLSHYNNQYDPVYGAGIQLLRSGDVRWQSVMDELAHHVVDIDIYHTTRDRAAYSGGLFWHTIHYASAATATHRAYSRRSTRHGGGPANEHCYTSGLLLHYYLTGEEASREAVVGLAQWVLAADDGAKTILGWLDRGPTGAASATRDRGYHGPGRGSGNAVNALLDGYLASGERRFLAAAETLIRRCVHPADSVADRNLLDVERRWSYTVFLQALGRYLDLKVEWDELAATYVYARASVLHYARWMAEHEVPYLSRPERLEFPTETWAAQDIRKSHVFDVAAKHAEGPERARFRERAEFFFRTSIDELTGSKTRTLARPVVILMQCAHVRAYFAGHPDEDAPVPPVTVDFGAPARFDPQRARVLRKVKLGGMLAAAAAAAGLLAVLG